jgi:glutamate-1-semialdehyde 2,1-aminomutase
VLEKFVRAGHDMREQGWWAPLAGQSNRTIRRGVLREVIATALGRRQGA